MGNQQGSKPRRRLLRNLFARHAAQFVPNISGDELAIFFAHFGFELNHRLEHLLPPFHRLGFYLESRVAFAAIGLVKLVPFHEFGRNGGSRRRQLLVFFLGFLRRLDAASIEQRKQGNREKQFEFHVRNVFVKSEKSEAKEGRRFHFPASG